MASPAMLAQRARYQLGNQIRSIIAMSFYTVTNTDFITEEELETIAYIINELKDLEVGYKERSEEIILLAKNGV